MRLNDEEARIANHGLIAVCRDCGGIEQLPADAASSFVDEARDAIGFTLEPGHFAVEGVCAMRAGVAS